jgi:hypothetical protein
LPVLFAVAMRMSLAYLFDAAGTSKVHARWQASALAP